MQLDVLLEQKIGERNFIDTSVGIEIEILEAPVFVNCLGFLHKIRFNVHSCT